MGSPVVPSQFVFISKYSKVVLMVVTQDAARASFVNLTHLIRIQSCDQRGRWPIRYPIAVSKQDFAFEPKLSS